MDLNEATNGKRFSTLPGDGIGVLSLTVGANLDGIISLKFVFDDSEYQSINGGDYSFLGQIGGHIYFQWDIMVKGDQHYLEALAKQEEAAIRHSGELASIQARFERSMSEGGKVAKEAEAKKEQEEALLASEVEERSRELTELEGNARLQAEEQSANAKEILRQRKELLEKKRVDQAVRLQLLNEGEIERNQRIQTEISTRKEGVEVSDEVDPLAEQNSDSVQDDDVKSHSPSFEEE